MPFGTAVIPFKSAKITGLELKTAELVHKYNLAAESLTETQLASAIAQAIASGDFVRIVVETDGPPDCAQSVVYIPYREVEMLRGRIRFLERKLEENGIGTEQETEQ